MESHKKTESSQYGEKALLCFLISKNAVHCVPNRITGKFAIHMGAFYFFPDAKNDGQIPQLKIWEGWRPDRTERILPLITFLAKEKLPIIIQGVHLERKGVYAVLSMKIKKEAFIIPGMMKYSDDFLDFMIRQLMNTAVCPEVPSDSERLPSLSELEEISAYFRLCKQSFPEWLSEAVQRELDRANNSNLPSDQRRHAKTALQYLVNIDWGKEELHVPDIDEAKRILDEEFFGLEAVKDRILEIIAQINRTGELPLWGILLNGPAGTGKTSIAKAIARLLNEPVIAVDVSSIGSDPEELAGSSRIYGNGKPGYVFEKMFSARSRNGVLLINELDKATAHGKDGKSGSADVLLTLLDRQGFYDNFLENAIPTDGLFAVATCNDIDKISAPLRNRFYVIDIPGYTPDEKKQIWRQYVIPRIRSRFCLSPCQMSFAEEAVDEIVKEYAVEPGVRDLEKYAERFAGVICKHLNESGDSYCYTFTVDDVKSLLGPGKRIHRNFAVNPGEINAVFYHEGRAHFFLLEAAVMPGGGKLKVLGPIPEVQKEYIRVAYECMKNTTSVDVSDKDISIFVPHALPVSADNHVGCAAYAAMCSLILGTGLEIQNIAFAGGVDLNGNLYFDAPDIKPLLKAAKEADIKTIYAPLGVSEMLCADTNCDITIIEAQQAQNLVSLAVAASGIK